MRIALRKPRDPFARRVLKRAKLNLPSVAVSLPLPGDRERAIEHNRAELDRLCAIAARNSVEDALEARRRRIAKAWQKLG